MNDVSEIQGVDPEVAKTLGLGEKPKSKARPLLTLAIVFIVLVILGVGFLMSRPRPINYELGTVELGTLEVRVAATGTLQPVDAVDVGVEVSGTIESISVDFNDQVTKGQVLAQINTDQLEARLQQSQAGLIQAEARLAEAKANLTEAALKNDRVQGLARTGNASRETQDSARLGLERAQANLKSAEAQVALSQAALDADQASLGKATVKAPIDGIVLDRLVEPGQTVAATFQTPVLFKIAQDLKRMELEVDIDEADIGVVTAGQEATFTVDAYPGRVFRARITSVHNAPQTEQGVTTYQAVLAVDNPDLALKPGLTATAEILVNTVTNSLLVPSGALRFVPEGQAAVPPTPIGDGSGAYRAKLWIANGQAPPRPIDVVAGAGNGEVTAVTGEGLKQGDKVIIDVIRLGPRGGMGPRPGFRPRPGASPGGRPPG